MATNTKGGCADDMPYGNMEDASSAESVWDLDGLVATLMCIKANAPHESNTDYIREAT